MGVAEQRSFRQLREHYEVEKELADRLRNAGKEERYRLYASVYDELFQRVRHHPQNTRKVDVEKQQLALAAQMRLLRRFLTHDTVFMEIGPGDCSLSKAVASQVAKVYAIDVSQEITRDSHLPSNFDLLLSDGASVPVPRNSINVAYSYQLIEHLHVDDAEEQVENIYAALAPGGVYVCVTPNRLSGPHDISKYFDKKSTGFHLKEYLTRELADMFRNAGFCNLRVYVGLGGHYLSTPVAPIVCIEKLALILPHEFRRWLAAGFPLRCVLGINLVAQK